MRNVVIDGGRRIRDIRVQSAKFVYKEDGDTCLHVTIDKPGDFSSYCICLIAPVETTADCLGDPPSAVERKIPEGIDPRYACAPLLFRTDRPVRWIANPSHALRNRFCRRRRSIIWRATFKVSAS